MGKTEKENRDISFKCFVCGARHELKTSAVCIGFSNITGEPEASAECPKCKAEMKVPLR